MTKGKGHANVLGSPWNVRQLNNGSPTKKDMAKLYRKKMCGKKSLIVIIFLLMQLLIFYRHCYEVHVW